jgi:putative flippase GtrA
VLSRIESPGSEQARFLRFILTGSVAAGANVISRYILSLALPYEAAVGIAYLVGMTTAFVLARLFVFTAVPGEIRGQYARFALVNAAAFLQVWIVSVGLARFAFPAVGVTWHAETLAHIIGVASPIVTSYFGHKHFSFRD